MARRQLEMIFKPSSDTSCSRSCPVRGCYSCATAGLVVFTNRRRRRGGARGDFLFLRRLVSVAFPAPHAWTVLPRPMAMRCTRCVGPCLLCIDLVQQPPVSIDKEGDWDPSASRRVG